MGIDIYMQWPDQTEAEKEAQITGCSVEAGNVGYLREAYHGGPYVTLFLVPEAFNAKNRRARIGASKLRARLPEAVALALYRNHVVYEQGNDPSRIDLDGTDAAAALNSALTATFAEIECLKAGAEPIKLTAEAQRAINEKIEGRALPAYALAFADFVTLAEKMEAKTGKPVTVRASY